MQRNFVLTDLMKTGNHQNIDNFILMHSLDNQDFTVTGEYYTLHQYDLDSYDRKFAIIDRTKYAPGHPADHPEFETELLRRKKLLHSQGFVFILATPWESQENIDTMDVYPKQTDEYSWSGGVDWFWFYMYQKHNTKTHLFDHGNKPYDFLYLNKRSRSHREQLFQKVSKAGLLENSLYTKWPNVKLPKEYELPWVQDYPSMGMDQDLYAKPYNDSKYSLISETNDNNNEIFMTEKIWKPIIAQQIFVLHGNYLYLQKLREMGFKTFSKYFDESYDLEMDRSKRIEKITATCLQLQKQNWKDLYLQTQALRQHNFDTFFNKEKLSEQINKTINLFLEFADSR